MPPENRFFAEKSAEKSDFLFLAPNSPTSPHSGALELQFAPGTFYKFVSLALMVLYQFQSLNLDDNNLPYIQNKNRSFEKILTATPLKLHHFLYTKIPQNQS